MKRRLPRDLRYAPNKRIAKLWMRRGGKRRMRRLERHAERDEEFDMLLDQSSLGTPNAKAIQALTPEEVIDAARRAAGRRSRGV